MPRKRTEDRPAAAFRAGKPPPAPEHLPPAAKLIWHEIVGSKPVDFWSAASLVLLEQLVFAAALLRILSRDLELAATDTTVGAAIARYSAIVRSASVKLRLSPSSALRAADGRLEEKPAPRNPLFGGDAVGPRVVALKPPVDAS